MIGEGGGSGGNQPVSGGFGIMRDTAMRHGKVADAAQFSTMQAGEDQRARQAKAWATEDQYKESTQSLFKRHANKEIDDYQLFSEMADIKVQYGDPNNALDAMLKSREFRTRMKDENAEEAAKSFLRNEPAIDVANIFNKVGNEKFTEARYELGKNSVGNPERVLVVKTKGGEEKRYGEEQIFTMASKDVRDYFLQLRKDAASSADKKADRDQKDRHHKDDIAVAREKIAADRVKANAADGTGGKFKDLSADDIKSSFTTYRDVLKPANGNTGAHVAREAVVDQAALAKFRAWAKANRYSDMNMALRDWDADGRHNPASNAAQRPAQKAPANRRPLSEIFR